MKKSILIFILNVSLASCGFIILKFYESFDVSIKLFYFCLKPTFQTPIIHSIILSVIFIAVIILINLVYFKIGKFQNKNYLLLLKNFELSQFFRGKINK